MSIDLEIERHERGCASDVPYSTGMSKWRDFPLKHCKWKTRKPRRRHNFNNVAGISHLWGRGVRKGVQKGVSISYPAPPN